MTFIERVASVSRRVWNAPIWCHCVALALILGCAAAWSGPPGRLFVDEGRAILQAQNLMDGNGWSLPWAFAEVDPSGAGFSIPRYSGDFVIYEKRPLYILILASVGRFGGVWAMLALSLAGTVIAAWAASRLVRLFDSGLERWAFWLAAMGTPLFFDSFLIVAHTLGAAAVTVAVLASLELVRGGTGWWVGGLGAASLLAVMVRTEAVLFLGAWALVLVLWGWRRRDRVCVLVGTGTLAVVVSARLADQWWAARITDGTISFAQEGSRAKTFDLLGRITGAAQTLVGPEHGFEGPKTGVLMILALLCLVAGTVMLRRDNPLGAGAFMVAYLLSLVAYVIFSDHVVIPGLLLVCPALVVALGCLDRSWFRDRIKACLTMSLGAFVLAVFVTQYTRGGTVEWGARYLAVALPVTAALVVVALDRAFTRLDGRVAAGTVSVIVVASLIVTSVSIDVLRHQHELTAEVVGGLLDGGVGTDPGDGDLPVIVSDDWGLALLAWPEYSQFRWVYRPKSDEQVWNEKLAAARVREYAEISRRLARRVTIYSLDEAGTASERP